ncbi:tRNA (guanine(37)-N1)-methyltransferase Trm5b [uncultured archaeon]|nr:tRNA (guanine(37)-N1)-methyltransferase Trm5b [uncultured archaeon]
MDHFHSCRSMPDKSLGLRVERKHGERLRKSLVESGLFDRSRKICSDETYVYLPALERNDEADEALSKVASFQWIELDFPAEEHQTTPEELLGFRPSFEVVGDIAMIEDEGNDAERIASALMATCKGIRTVIAPISDVEGEYRTRRFRHVAGDRRTVTVHREHGLCYLVDLEGAYFTERLGTERKRVADQTRPGQMVLDMFAGVGPFALLMAKRGARVVAIDKNPVAVKCLRENAIRNKVLDIEILEGDARELALSYENSADHVIMNLPHSASEFLDSALRAAKPGGVIHYYCIAPEDDLYRDWKTIESAAERIGASVEVVYQGIVRSYAPHRHNVVIDFRKKGSV